MEETSGDQLPSQQSAKKKWLRPEVRYTLSAVVFLFVFEYILLPEFASARRNVHILSTVNVPLLIVAVAFEIGALLAYAELSRTVFAPDPPNHWTMLRINMSSLSVSHVVPGGTAAGGALGYRLLTDAGVPGSTAAFGLATQGVGSAVVLNILFFLSLLISIPLNGVNRLYGTAALLGVLLLAAFGGTVLLLIRGQRHADDWLRKVATKVPFLTPEKVSDLLQKLVDRLIILFSNRKLLFKAMGWAAANWILDAGCLWVILLAFGKAVMPIDLLVAYGLANILAAIPITPGGLGVVEFTLSGALAGFGVPASIAYLSVIAWRLINFWLPIPLGGASYLSLRISSRRRHRIPRAEGA
jgi:putative heme transporter